MKPELLPTTPEAIAPDTWLIPTLAADPAGGYLGAHSAVIRGAEPVIIDTSVLFGRDRFHVLLVSDVLREASGQIGIILVRGTPSFPKFTPEPFPLATEAIKSMSRSPRTP